MDQRNVETLVSINKQGWASPMPHHQYQGWIKVFHLLFVGSMALGIYMVWQLSDGAMARQHWLVTSLIGVQTILYLIGFMLLPRRVGWPLPLGWLFFHFGSGVLITLVNWSLMPMTSWMLWPYMGQMMGILPFRIAGPVASALFVLWVALERGWLTGSAIAVNTLGPFFFYWLGFIVSGFYIYQLIKASQQRGALITELETTKRQLEDARARDAELAALQERERLARDMHDGLGHTLVALSMQLEAVQRLYPIDPIQASAQIDEMKTLTRNSMASLRRTLAGLRASGLGEHPLHAALETLCGDFRERTGIDHSYQIDAACDGLPRAVAEAVWRVAQESLTNIEKHAQAQCVELTVAVEPLQVAVAIIDDGVGLPNNAEARPNHYGLRGMRERIEGLGGELLLYSNGTGGTHVEATVPKVGS